MLDAHTQAGFLVGVPFAHGGDYDFTLHGGEIPSTQMTSLKEAVAAQCDAAGAI